MSRIILGTLSAVALFAFTYQAEGQDLKAAAERQKIAAQKLTNNVNDAIEASKKQDPRDAKVDLRNLLDRVRDSQDLLPSEQAKLVQRLRARLDAIDRTIRDRAAVEDRPPVRDVPKSGRPPVNDNSGVGGMAKKFTDQGKAATKLYNDIERDRIKGIQGLNKGIETSAVIPDRDFAFPADWKERSERFKKLFGPQLTEKEVKVIKTLNSVLSVKYDGEKLKAVVKHLQDRTGLAIIVDMASLQELNIDYDGAMVNFEVEKASVRTILKKVFGDHQLTYIIKEGAIQVMTADKASKYTVVRSYNVGDLVIGDPQAALMVNQAFGPFGSKLMREQNAMQLIQMIQTVIEPNYWQPNGPGSILYFDATRSLIIRGSAEMHYQLDTPGLFGGR